jgi:hypothetical protein
LNHIGQREHQSSKENNSVHYENVIDHPSATGKVVAKNQCELDQTLDVHFVDGRGPN